MNRFAAIPTLLVLLCAATAHETIKRSIFSWSKDSSSRGTEVKDQEAVPGYFPTLQVHKYQGVQINPVDGPPVYLSREEVPPSDGPVPADQFYATQLAPEHARQLELLNKVVTYLPEESQLHEYDFDALLPYAELIPDDSLARIQFAVESAHTKQQSKLLKVIHFLKALKEKKLKPFKAAASFGATLFGKKKATVNGLLHLSQPPVTYPPPPPPPPPPTLPPPPPTFVFEPPTWPATISVGGYPPTRPPYLYPNPPIFPLPTIPPPSNDQPQQEVAPPPSPPRHRHTRPNDVHVDGHVDGHVLHDADPQTPADTHLFSAADQQNQIVAFPAAAYYAHQPAAYSQPWQAQAQYAAHAADADASAAPYQTPTAYTRSHHPYADEPYAAKASTAIVYRTAEPHDKKSVRTPPAATHATDDLAASASDNVENTKADADSVSGVDAISREKADERVNQTHGDGSTSPKPRTTKLRPVSVKPPVYVFPDASAAELTPQNSESALQPLSQPSSSPSYEPNELRI